MPEPSLRKSLLMFQTCRRVAYDVFVRAPQPDGIALVDADLSLCGLYSLPEVLGRFRLPPFQEAAFPESELIPGELQLRETEARSLVRLELDRGALPAVLRGATSGARPRSRPSPSLALASCATPAPAPPVGTTGGTYTGTGAAAVVSGPSGPQGPYQLSVELVLTESGGAVVGNAIAFTSNTVGVSCQSGGSGTVTYGAFALARRP